MQMVIHRDYRALLEETLFSRKTRNEKRSEPLRTAGPASHPSFHRTMEDFGRTDVPRGTETHQCVSAKLRRFLSASD